MSQLTINTPLVRRMLVGFLQDEIWKVGAKKAVLGLSGGIDSALVCHLAAEALGPENVHAICMPYKTSNPESEAHARLVAEASGVRFSVGELRRWRMPTRSFRMPTICGAAIRWPVTDDHPVRPFCPVGRTVLGTRNKTDSAGVWHIYGDMALRSSIGELYKTQVWQLSEEVGVPKPVIEKKPSADLWAGQTDEEELGFTYREVDELLYRMVDQRADSAELVAAGFKQEFISSIYNKVQNSHFKRRLPVIAKVSGRTIDRDFATRDWGK